MNSNTVNIRRWAVLVLLLISTLITACGGLSSDPTFTPELETTPNLDLLVDSDWVSAHLDDQSLRIVDLRPREDYDRGHVPGAVQLDLTAVRATVNGVRGQVAAPETVEALLSERGIDHDTTVVIYDTATGIDAARLFWTLEYYGHPDARLLDGGWEAWQRADGPLSTETPDVAPTNFVAQPQPELIANAAWMLNHLEEESLTIVDARSPQEYRGEDVRSERGGHIPGAINVDWRTTLQENGAFKSPNEIQTLYQAAGLEPGQTTVTYCQTGHRAAHDYFTLRLLGYDVRVYDGSWEEWGNRTDTPVE